MSPGKRKGRDASRRRATQAAARAESHRRRRQLQIRIAGVLAILVVIALLGGLLFSGGASDEPRSATTTTTTEPGDDDEPIADDPDATTTEPFEFGTSPCPPDERPAETPESFDAPPQHCLEDGVDYAAVVETSEGSFTIDLLEDRAPGTVNNFVFLARWGWFDGIEFHRVVPGFVNQTGDPTGTGSGGPGYTIADELPTGVSSYEKWAVAMANAGPDSNGSQWFTCIDCSRLPNPGFSLFGQVTEGRDVVQAINDLGEGDGPPSRPVTITSVTITEH